MDDPNRSHFPPYRAMFPTDDSIAEYQRLLPELSAADRKAIVTLCRAQYVPKTTEARILAYQVFGQPLGCYRGDQTPLRRTVRLIEDYITSPVYSGLILDMARACEPSEDELRELESKSWSKEVNACNSERRKSTINFQAVFGGQFHQSLVPFTEPRPDVNEYIFDCLVEWRESIAKKVIFPKISKKAMSRASVREITQVWPTWRLDMRGKGDEEHIPSQVTMERLYADTGYVTSGPCEVRQKLYRAGIVPRTYFAQGGEAYFSSRFLSQACISLVDSIPSCHHVYRLLPTNLDFPASGNHVFIYDLTSFTSMFHEFLPFIRALGDFCSGTTVTVWDGHNGHVDYDLGDLFHDYADANADEPSYSLERLLKDESAIVHHAVAGFLGVYGNLMLCTFLHCIVVLSIVGSVKRVYTAGDDGGVTLWALLRLIWEKGCPPRPDMDPRADVAVLFYALTLLGVIQWSKVFTTAEAGAIALKRPLQVFEDRLVAPMMLVWPQSILISAYLNWKHHKDRRFRTYYMHNTRQECRSAVATEVLRFLRNVSVMEHRISQTQLGSIHEYLKWVYHQMNFPLCGSVPQFTVFPGDSMVAMLPRDDDLSFYYKDPIRRTIDRHWTGWAEIPVRESENQYPLSDDTSLFVGSEFYATQTPLLGYLAKLQYLEKTKMFRRVYGSESYDLVIREYLDLNPPKHVFHYKVVALPPILS